MGPHVLVHANGGKTVLGGLNIGLMVHHHVYEKMEDRKVKQGPIQMKRMPDGQQSCTVELNLRVLQPQGDSLADTGCSRTTTDDRVEMTAIPSLEHCPARYHDECGEMLRWQKMREGDADDTTSPRGRHGQCMDAQDMWLYSHFLYLVLGPPTERYPVRKVRQMPKTLLVLGHSSD